MLLFDCISIIAKLRYVEMQNWSLTLTPVDTEKGTCFLAQYYENGKEELSFGVRTDYDCMLCKEKYRTMMILQKIKKSRA